MPWRLLWEWAADMAVAEGCGYSKPSTYAQLLKSRDPELGKGGLIATVPLLRETGGDDEHFARRRYPRSRIEEFAGLLKNYPPGHGFRSEEQDRRRYLMAGLIAQSVAARAGPSTLANDQIVT